MLIFSHMTQIGLQNDSKFVIWLKNSAKLAKKRILKTVLEWL